MRRCKATVAQLEYMVGFMKDHPIMASGLNQSLKDRAKVETLWNRLATTLNSQGGAIKSVSKWKQAWRDLRNNLKKKNQLSTTGCTTGSSGSTGDGPPTNIEFKEIEESVYTVMAPVAVYGMEDVMSTEPILNTDCSGPSGNSEPELELEEGTTPVLPDEAVTPHLPPTTRKRSHVVTEHDNFERKLLEFEEEKIRIKRERNEIERERNTVLHRMVDLLQDICNHRIV